MTTLNKIDDTSKYIKKVTKSDREEGRQPYYLGKVKVFPGQPLTALSILYLQTETGLLIS